MALPKRRISKTRGRKRRTHQALTAPGVSVCPHCNAVGEPHRVCHNCGHYQGREVVKKEQA